MPNKTFIKEISLGLMTVIVGIFFWLAVLRAFQMQFVQDSLTLTGWSALIYAVVAFSLLLTFLGIFSVLARNHWIMYSVLLLIAATPLIFFRNGYYSLFIVVSSLMMLAFYAKYCQEETKSRYKFSITRSTYFGQSLVVMVLLIAVSLTYYVAITHEKSEEKVLENSIVRITTNALNKIMETNMPGYDPNMTLDDWLGNQQIQKVFDSLPQYLGSGVISEELRQQFEKSAQYQQIISEAERQSKQEAIDQLRNDFLKQFDIEASGDEPISSVLNKMVQKSVGNIVTPYTRFISPVLAISLFLVLRLLTPLYIALTRFFQWFIFTLLLKLKFIIVKKEQKEAITVSL